jgi:hypothetical protein
MIFFLIFCIVHINASLLFIIDNHPNPNPTPILVQNGPWYNIPINSQYNIYSTTCTKTPYLPTCQPSPFASWLMSNSFNPAAGYACYLQATCNLDQSMVTISGYSEPTCSTSARIINTVPSDSTINHLIPFGITVIANCE